MTAAEFVDGTGPQLPTVGPRGNLHGPAANKAEGTPAVALSGVPLPTHRCFSCWLMGGKTPRWFR